MQRGSKIVSLIISLVIFLFFLSFVANFLRTFLRSGDVGSLVAVVVFMGFFGLPFIMGLRASVKSLRKTQAGKNASGVRRTDFMTNRTTGGTAQSPRLRQDNQNESPAPPPVRNTAVPMQKGLINGVEWRWPGGKPKARNLAAYCSKCGQALTVKNNTESWQADLHCATCHKDFVSIPGQGPDGGKRTFEKTKKLAAQMLNARNF